MHIYGIPEPIWQQIGCKTLTTTTKLVLILLRESQQWLWSQLLWNTNDKMGYNHFWTFVIFQYGGLHHLNMYCTWTIEVLLKSSSHFDCIYRELWNACIIGLVFIVLNDRDKIESKYPSIVFLSIHVILKRILCRINLAIVLYGLAHAHQISSFICCHEDTSANHLTRISI